MASKTKNRILELIEYLELQKVTLGKMSERFIVGGFNVIATEMLMIESQIKLLRELASILREIETLRPAQRLHGEAKHWENIIAWANIQDYSIVRFEAA